MNIYIHSRFSRELCPVIGINKPRAAADEKTGNCLLCSLFTEIRRDCLQLAIQIILLHLKTPGKF